jgi:Uncharacterized conserved protein
MASHQNPSHSKSSHDALRDTTHQLKEDVVRLGRTTRDIAHETMDHLKENAGEVYHQGLEKAQDWEKNLEKRIQKNPMKAVLIAAGIGLVLGAIWNRK